MFSAEEENSDQESGLNLTNIGTPNSSSSWRHIIALQNLLLRQEELCGAPRNQSQVELIEAFRFWGEGVAIR